MGKEMEQFKKEVEQELKNRFGINIDDATDDKNLQNCYFAQWTPKQVVDWIGNKYDLEEISC